MKNTRLCKDWDSERYLPPELWPGILCRLPVKSLLRFRCVSKLWLSLIDDPEFARIHFKNFKNNCHETHLIVAHGCGRNCVVRSSDTFETNSETLISLGGNYDEGSWHFVCSMDGLVLLKSESKLKVWNPSIRKFHDVPSLPRIEKSPHRFLQGAEIGLGYDPLANDYKLVKLIFSNHITLHSVAVYTLGTGSWKRIRFQGKGCSNWHWEHSYIYTKKIYFQGSLYFLARDVDKQQGVFFHQRDVWDLVSFDMSSEVFSSIRLPGRSSAINGWDELALIDGGYSLAVLDTSSRDKSVWVLESSRDGSESMCWTKRYSFRLKYTQFLYVKKNGDVLTRKGRQEALTDETGRKWVRWDQVASYSPETKEYKIVHERKGSLYVISHVLAYAENLFLLK